MLTTLSKGLPDNSTIKSNAEINLQDFSRALSEETPDTFIRFITTTLSFMDNNQAINTINQLKQKSPKWLKELKYFKKQHQLLLKK